MNDLLLTLLAEEPNRGPDYGKASPVGLLVVVLLLIGLFVLLRSMNRQLKKVPATFDTDTAAVDAAPAARAVDADRAAGPVDADRAAGSIDADRAAGSIDADRAAGATQETEVPPRESGG